MILKSNCKINIGLNITEKRITDGYHLLESLFYPIYGLADLVEVVRSNEPQRVIFSQSGLIVDAPTEKNLCVKAYNAFAARYDIGAVKIHLHKKIPFGAGIGGGSSNAATVIVALNQLFDMQLSDSELCKVASMVGSDVPFFIYNCPKYVTGTGDILNDTDLNLSGRYVTLVKPDFSVNTAQAYSMITPSQPKIALKELLNQDFSTWRNNIKNDFEAPIFSLNPLLGEIKSRLYDLGAVYVSMSGSGSVIYAISDSELKVGNEFEGMFTFVSKL